MANDLTGQNIQDTYKRVLTVGDDGLMYDGTGSLFTHTNLTASGHISTSGEIYASNIVLAPEGSITPSSNQESIYFRNKLSGSGEGIMEWMEVGDDKIHLNVEGDPYLSLTPNSVIFNNAQDDIIYTLKDTVGK